LSAQECGAASVLEAGGAVRAIVNECQGNRTEAGPAIYALGTGNLPPKPDRITAAPKMFA
jgi:hypothetical protein